MMLGTRAWCFGALVTATVAAFAPPSLAQSPPVAQVVSIGVVPVAPADAGADARALADELARCTVRARADVRALQSRHDATSFAPLRDAFQQRIEAVKRQERLDLLDIRLRHAQASGRADEARELAAAIDAARRLPAPALREFPAEPPAPPAAAAPLRVRKEAGR
ncbi:MAG: hypothetical protein U0704_03640 [Candidatus Eisenbacteria bacterium]